MSVIPVGLTVVATGCGWDVCVLSIANAFGPRWDGTVAWIGSGNLVACLHGWFCLGIKPIFLRGVAV